MSVSIKALILCSGLGPKIKALIESSAKRRGGNLFYCHDKISLTVRNAIP